MLQYFRINDPYRLLGLLVIALIIYLPVFLDSPPASVPELQSFIVGEKIQEGFKPYTTLIDSTPPLVSWFYGLMDVFTGRNLLARHLMAFFIIVLQSIYLGIIFINKKVFAESTYLPSLLYVVLFAFSYDTVSLTGELIGSGFLLLALSNLFEEIEFRMQRDETVLSLGLFVGLATQFVFSHIVFLPAAALVLAIYSRRDVRSFGLLLVGFLLPHLLLAAAYLLVGRAGALVQFYYLPNLNFDTIHFTSLRSLLILGGLPLFYLLISIVMLNREARFTKYQAQLLQTMFIWMIFSFFQILYAKNLRPQSLVSLIPPVVFFITHFFLLTRRKRLAEISLLMLMIGVVSINVLARYGRLSSVSYDKLRVEQADVTTPIEGKRILVLDDDLFYFVNNKLATGFLNWQISQSIFLDPGRYENVIMVYESFLKDPPEIIIDPYHRMEGFFDRIPELREQYKYSEPAMFIRQ